MDDQGISGISIVAAIREHAMRLSALIVSLCLGLGTAAAQPPAPEDCTARYPGVNARLDRVGRLLIGGQPDEAALRALVGDGVRTVVNLRSHAEMTDPARVPFDEAAVLQELGVRYLHVPVNNTPEYPWRPEVLDALRDALSQTAGDVLLHCQSGIRTSWAYAAYCIREESLPLDEAHDLVGVLQDDPSGDPVCELLGVTPILELAREGASPVPPQHACAPDELAPPPTGLHGAALSSPELVTDLPGEVSRVLARVGPIYIAGQPSERAFRAFKDEGVTVVINLRTPHEMENREWVAFDEGALLTELGIDYVWVPMGGHEHPWTPECVDAVARALANHEGKAVIHCQVAWRASLMWAAYLVRHRGMDLNEAMDIAGTIYPLALPFEGMLGTSIVRRIRE